jgi:hypothetical protein
MPLSAIVKTTERPRDGAYRTVDSVRAALEQMWTRRLELEDIGEAAGKSIRAFVPADPTGVFSNKI